MSGNSAGSSFVIVQPDSRTLAAITQAGITPYLFIGCCLISVIQLSQIDVYALSHRPDLRGCETVFLRCFQVLHHQGHITQFFQLLKINPIVQVAKSGPPNRILERSNTLLLANRGLNCVAATATPMVFNSLNKI